MMPPKAFVADVMLGRLARWLRMLGYDAVYEKSASDEQLLDCTLREHRWLLTRDRCLVTRKALRDRATLLTSDDLGEQLRQLERDLQISMTVRPDTARRCPECNTELRAIPRSEAVPSVPPFVAAQHHEFFRCCACGRIYWPGSHWTHVLEQLDAFKEGRAG